eukprot:jgi/Botrbrau1/19329/Bobra.0073s0060.2
MEGDPDLMSVGEHCSVVDCSQKDFLPFVCDCCNLPFCLEHRTYARHGCSKAKGMQSQTMVCPLCAKAIRYEGQDPNVAFEAHTREACDPSNYDRVHRKAKCPVPGCKEKLSSINTYKCKDCKANVCLKHRFPSDHQCNPAAARAQHTTLPALRRFWGGRDLQVEAPKAVDKVKHVKGTQRKVEKEAHLHVIANSLRETAFRRQAAAEVCWGYPTSESTFVCFHTLRVSANF